MTACSVGHCRVQLSLQSADDQIGEPDRGSGDVAAAAGGFNPFPGLSLVDVEAVKRRDQAGAIRAEQCGKPALQRREALFSYMQEVDRAVNAWRQAVSHESRSDARSACR